MITQFEDPARRLDIRVKIGRVDEAEDFLLRLRSILHLKIGRNLNVLTHELQETAAPLFGSPDDPPAGQVEALMSTYFHHARIVNRALGASLKALAQPADGAPVDVADGLQRRDDEILFTDGTRASLQPRTWLRAFETALDEGCAVSEQVLTCIERHGGRYSPERFFPAAEERDALLRVLRPRPGLYARLSEMHNCGLLGRMFPEFHKVYCLVIRDFYHKYTVDEHTLQTIRNLELLCQPTSRGRRRFANLLAETPGAELLVLALLFHDVGKWTNRNHSEEGVRMALGALRRIRLPEPDIATVEFLIRHHLRMSTAAFRRDTDDPDAVVHFARLVGNEQRLKLLCLLTLADVSAVGPDVMTPWKEDLLWRLYVDTYNRLTLGYGDDVIDTAAASLAELQESRPADIAQGELETFLQGLPQRYLRLVDKPHVYEHVRLSRNLQAPDVHCLLEQKGSAWELALVSADQPGLFSKVCGVLSYFGMDILRGQAMTNRHGTAVDLVEFTDRERFFELNEAARPDLTNLLADVVGGRQDIDEILLPKQRGMARREPVRIKPVVHFDNAYSERYSILEILAQDAWGLLYRISTVISQQRCDIEFVLISTGATAPSTCSISRRTTPSCPRRTLPRCSRAWKRCWRPAAGPRLAPRVADEADQGNRAAEPGRRHQGRARQQRHLGHDRDRGARPRAPARALDRLSRQRVRGEPAAQDGDRGRRARRPRGRRHRVDHGHGPDRRDGRRTGVRHARRAGIHHSHRREGRSLRT